MDILSYLEGSGQQEAGGRSLDMARVTNIDDPQGLGRVKCKWLSDSEEVGELDWAFALSPFAGDQYGAFWHPSVGDLVLVGYLGGCIQRPLVLGALWNQKDAHSPAAIREGKNETFVLRTPGGSELRFMDTAQKRKATLSTPAGYTLTLDEENKRVTLGQGDNSLTLDLQGGNMELKAAGKLTLRAGSASVVLDGQSGQISCQAQSKLTLKGAQLEASFTGTCKLAANGQMSVESTGITQVKGSLLKLN